jgi:hypothetical protein
MTKRIFVFISIAVAIFASGLLLLGGIAAALYYFHANVFDNPLVASLFQETPQDQQSNNGGQEPSGPILTDIGNYQTENNWLASTIADEIAGMAWLAAHPNGPVPTFQVKATVAPQKCLVHVEIKGWSPDQTITADLTPTYAWDPQGYVPLAHQLMGSLQATAPAGADTSDILDDLLTPTGKELAIKDVELSRQMLQTPASANVHDKAALLLLTLALREHAGIFSDSRRLLCRATAHLALAQSLRGDGQPGWPGQIADATLRSLSGREADALQYLDILSQETDSTDAAKIWIRVLKLWNKIDWRLESPDGRSPLLLKLVWFDTVTETTWDSQSNPKLDAIAPLKNIPDWGRMIFSVNDVASLEVGQRFCESTIALEFRELKEILAAENEPKDDTISLAKLFTDPIHPTVFFASSGKNEANIIGTAVFKDIALRHLFSAIRQTHGWMIQTWGVPDQDAQFISQVEKSFQGVPNEKYLTMQFQVENFATRPEPTGLHADVADIPPLLAFWTMWRDANSQRLVSYYAWGIPFGAPCCMDVRSTVLSAVEPGRPHVSSNEPLPPTFSDLKSLAPYSYDIASWVIVDKNARGQHMTKDQVQALLQPFFDYNAFALHYFNGLAASQNEFDDATLEATLRKECAQAPGQYFELGARLRKDGKIDEAAAADRNGVKLAQDQVLVSDSVRPLVEYDYAHGQIDEATQVAEQAANVYSADGIWTYVWLLCKLNRFDEAEQWAQKEQERYGGDDLSIFYVEHRDHFADRYKTIEQTYFPNGLQHVGLSSFAGAPQGGCQFIESSDLLQSAGLQEGDVVVALNSFPVVSTSTYKFIRALSDDPAMDLIIWRSGKYQEIKTSAPNRRFGAKFQNYPSQ